MVTALRILVIHSWPQAHWDIEQIFKKHPELTFVGACDTLAETKIVARATQPDAIVVALNTTEENQIFALALGASRFKIIFLVRPEDDDGIPLPPDHAPYSKEMFLRTLSHTLEENFSYDQIEEATAFKKNAVVTYNRIALRTPTYVQLVTFDEVLYCHSDAGYTTFYLTEDRKVVTSKPLKEFEDTLPLSHFVRTHQSYLVNHHFIDKIFKGAYLLLRDGTQIPVAVRKRTEISRLLSREIIVKHAREAK